MKQLKTFIRSGWQSATRAEFDEVLDYIDSKYYVDAKKPITDLEYDQLMANYFQRFPKSKRKAKVGHSSGNKRKEVDLPYPMSSLDKVKSQKDFELYTKKFTGPYVVSDKEDGMGLELLYDKGRPSKLFTRGNGLKGQDISHLLPYIKSIPKKISITTEFAVRVEGISPNSAFAKHMDKKAGGKFTAVRNAAGGIINKLPTSKDFHEYAELAKHLTLFAFKILGGKGSTDKPSKQLKLLDSLGFTVVPHKIFRTIDQTTMSDYLNKRIKAVDYDIDGLVIEQDEYYKAGHALPKHAISFKENSIASMVDIPVESVVWEAGRTGKITPVVTIKPTKIGGVMVSNFTGHNAFYIQHGYLKGSEEDRAGAKPRPIGKGAIIRAVRSGGVIPYIVEVVKPARKPDMPNIPYVMKGVFAVLDGKKSKTSNNEGHDLSLQKKIEHFFVRIGVDGFKLSTVQKFWDNGYTKLSQFLKLKKKDFVSIDGLGERKALQFEQSLTKALSELTFSKIADASGYLPNFGTRRFDMIYKTYPDVLDWPEKYTKAVIISRVQSISGFKELAVDFAIALPKIVKFINTFKLEVKAVKKVVKGSAFKDLRVTFTGVRNDALTKAIEEQGGTVQDMRKDTNLVLVKEIGFSSGTTAKANAAGISILTVDQFKKKYKLKD